MKQSDRISYEKPELTDYRFWGVVNGEGQSQGDDQTGPNLDCDDFIDKD